MEITNKKIHPAAPLTYKDAGVDIDAGNNLVERIKHLCTSTARPGTTAHLGGFGAFFDLAKLSYKDPLLVSTTDGVGTKLKIAQQINKHDTIGIDLVAMCVNDLVVQGAEPLFFLDYFASGVLHVDQATSVIEGIIRGCKKAGCALIGGETAEMPGMYKTGEYDLAGFAVGIVERTRALPQLSEIQDGDIILGLASSGLHATGFSLVRHLIAINDIDLYEQPPFESSHATLYETLLEPTTIYTPSVLPLVRDGSIKALAHITGGGLIENIPRILPIGISAELESQSWHIPSLFRWISQTGNITDQEMRRTFNMGIGMIAVVAQEDAPHVQETFEQHGQAVYRIGTLREKTSNEDKVSFI